MQSSMEAEARVVDAFRTTLGSTHNAYTAYQAAEVAYRKLHPEVTNQRTVIRRVHTIMSRAISDHTAMKSWV